MAIRMPPFCIKKDAHFRASSFNILRNDVAGHSAVSLLICRLCFAEANNLLICTIQIAKRNKKYRFSDSTARKWEAKVMHLCFIIVAAVPEYPVSGWSAPLSVLPAQGCVSVFPDRHYKSRLQRQPSYPRALRFQSGSPTTHRPRREK